MKNYFLQIGSAVLVAGSWGLSVFLLWAFHRQWWGVRWVRRLSWQLPLAGLMFVGLWYLGYSLDLFAVSVAAAVGTIIFITTGLALLIALPFSGTVLSLERLAKWIAAKWPRPKAPAATLPESVPAAASPGAVASAGTLPSPMRRSLLAKGAVVIPGTLLAANAWGLADAWSAVHIPTVPLRYPNLPAELRGLRILHLSDIHLGYFIFMKDLEECMIAAERFRPDLVLVSGDVADELHELPAALRMIADLKPRYGTFASLGNHEYYRGIGTVQKSFDRSPIPLLREEGTAVNVGKGSQLFIGGADDPARNGKERDRPQFLQRTVDATLQGAPSDAFHILMSHRPEGWDRAAQEGIELTVAGHYHGGVQIGFGGRGIIEPLVPNNYIWGHYQRGNSHLYTSAGVGHWLPFRLGCPREAPLYVLEQA